MGLSRRISAVLSAVVALAAIGTGAVVSAAPAGASVANAAPVFFLPQHYQDKDMANRDLWLNVRIANAHNDLSDVELWERQAAPEPGYVYYKNLYDASYLTAPSGSGGSVYTSPFQASRKQMWKVTLMEDLSYQVRNLGVDGSLLLTFHPSSLDMPFTMNPGGASDQRFYINPLA
jgi:hypothetical protein